MMFSRLQTPFITVVHIAAIARLLLHRACLYGSRCLLHGVQLRIRSLSIRSWPRSGSQISKDPHEFELVKLRHVQLSGIKTFEQILQTVFDVIKMPEIPKQMKAVQVVEFKKPYRVNIVDVPTPPTPNDILVKVAVAGYCHTEQLVAEGVFNSELPLTASHEGSGTVVFVGSNVKDFTPGDRVMVGIMTHACGKCRSCQLGPDMKHYCQHSDSMTGVTRDGCFAEYVWADASECQKLPDGVTFETAAPMACAGRTAYRSIAQAKLQPGQTIGIVGAGGALGHLGIQFAKKIWGLKVVGVDARDPGLDLARKTGADLVVDARDDKQKLVKQVMDFTGESEGCDATVNFSDAGSAAATACAITKMHARMIQVAQPDEVSVPFAELVFRDIRIEGSLLCPAVQSQKMLEDVAKHGISVTTNASHGLENVKEAAERAHGGKMSGKAIVIVDEVQIKQEREKHGASI